MRVESFAIFTVQDKFDRWVPLEIETWDWHAWLERVVLRGAGGETLEVRARVYPDATCSRRSRATAV